MTCEKCNCKEEEPNPQYVVCGQDLMQFEYMKGKWKDENKHRELCDEHKMEDTFLPSRGQYKKCFICGYYETLHGGSYF